MGWTSQRRVGGRSVLRNGDVAAQSRGSLEDRPRLTKLQDQVLDIAAQLVHPTGHIVFVTCSLLDAEGADRIEAFLTRHGGWEAPAIGLPAGSKRGKGMRLDPYHAGTDGFFVAMLRPGC